MVALLCFLLTLFASPFKSKSRLEAENAALRHQLTVLRRKVRGRVQLTNDDRLFLIQLYRWFPSILKVITIIRPETLVRWHRAGFRRYWRWKSRSLGSRPQIDVDLRALIRRISMDNPLWGAPRIHGELLELGFEVAQSSVAKLSLPKISSGLDSLVRQNHCIIRYDACDPAFAREVRRRHIQVATQARSREPVSPSSAQHRIEASGASSAAARR